ncbi:hypothetical protein [Pectinatus frisingensis]|uniref:hypothetical protein n=1 Tax=Pectinatus frisingensis TaxID=865 RepID=UPI0018C56D0A|nr:hypothetical protein [Pectinatus frisingensis]
MDTPTHNVKCVDIPNVKGVEITLNNKIYILPPLPIKAYSKGNATEQIKQIQSDFKDAGKNNDIIISKESIASLVSLTTIALQRNYPDIKEEDVEDGIIDITTLCKIFGFLISQDNTVKQKMQEAEKNAFREFVKKADKQQ